MTKIIDAVHVRTYEEWQKLEGVQVLYGELQDCPTCEGEGGHECECGHSHDCGECNGTGKQEDTRDIYEGLLRAEIKKLQEVRAGLPAKRLLSHLIVDDPQESDERATGRTIAFNINPAVPGP